MYLPRAVPNTTTLTYQNHHVFLLLYLPGCDPAVEELSPKTEVGQPRHRKALPLGSVAKDHQPLALAAQLLQALHGSGQGVSPIFDFEVAEMRYVLLYAK